MITIKGQPDVITPVYNPVVYYIDSTNKNQPGFRYVVDLYSAGTANKIAEFRVAPRPNDGYGYIDISKILQTQLSFDFSPSAFSTYKALNSFVNYDIKFGEEYNVNWTFTDTQFESGNITRFNQTPNSVPHTFIVGDQIIVSQTLDYIPNAEGLHTVKSVPDAYNVVIDVPFIVSPLNPGVIAYADNRKTIFRDLSSIEECIAFNGALSFKNFPNYSFLNYALDNTVSNTRSLLTNMPVSGFWATPTQDLWVNIMKKSTDNINQRIMFTNSNGESFYSDAWSVGVNNSTITQGAIGPGNAIALVSLSGATFPLIKSNTEWYDVKIFTPSISATTKTYRINIDRRCKIEDYEIVFQDRMGSFMSFAFQLKAEETGNIERMMYTQQLGDLSGSKFSYDSTGRGSVITNVKLKREIKLNTNWMSEEMSVYFDELLTSPVTYLKVDGKYYACIIKDSTYRVERQRNKNLIQKTVTVQFANDEIINI